MQTKPLIGVTSLYDNARESVWMIPGYLEALSVCGALPVILPFSPSDAALMVEECDGILFTGGNDVDPPLYEEDPDPRLWRVMPTGQIPRKGRKPLNESGKTPARAMG